MVAADRHMGFPCARAVYGKEMARCNIVYVGQDSKPRAGEDVDSPYHRKQEATAAVQATDRRLEGVVGNATLSEMAEHPVGRKLQDNS